MATAAARRMVMKESASFWGRLRGLWEYGMRFIIGGEGGGGLCRRRRKREREREK